MDTHLIPAKLYKKIVETVPILCVDVILYDDKWNYILVRRATEPLKGQWWVPGGRAFKGERTIDAAKRKVMEELGVKAKDFELEGIYEDHYPKSAWGVPTSSVSIVYSALADSDDFNPNATITEVKLSRFLPARFLKHLR